MTKIFALFFLFMASAQAYVPTVESLFRHGSNPEVSANGLVLTFQLKKIIPGEKSGSSMNDVALLGDVDSEDFYKVFISQMDEVIKLSQTRYTNKSFSETSLVQKTYFPNFTPYTIKANLQETQRGIFYGLLFSLARNDGSYLLSYLKTLGVPVRLNNEIINREKVEFLAEYKRYLAMIARDKSAKKTEPNPMRPEDPDARERVEQIMARPMYVDTNQVSLERDEGKMSWMVKAGDFQAVISYKARDVQRVKYSSADGEFEIICKDYFLANGTHAFPRYLLVKTFNGEQFQLETLNLRQFVEKEEDLIKRLGRWDQILKGKNSVELRPDFLF